MADEKLEVLTICSVCKAIRIDEFIQSKGEREND